MATYLDISLSRYQVDIAIYLDIKYVHGNSSRYQVYMATYLDINIYSLISE